MAFAPSGADDADLARKMAEDGYLYIPRLLTPARVHDAREDIAAVLAAATLLAPGAAPGRLHYRGGEAPGRDVLVAVHREINLLPAFNGLATQEGAMQVMRRLLGAHAVPHTRKICRVKYPHDAYDVVRPHQDFWYVKGAEETYTCWAPLTDTDAELGGLAVLARSHKRETIAHVQPVDSRFHGVEDTDQDADWTWSPMRVGDALIFHSLTIHAGLPNSSQTIRLSVDFRYQRSDAPMEPSHSRPHME